MNSTASKRYIGEVTQSIPTHEVVNGDTDEVIAEDDEHGCNLIALGYNHYYCLPNFPNKYFVQPIKQKS